MVQDVKVVGADRKIASIVGDADPVDRENDEPRLAPARVRRIICFKVDHIGDLLIAAPALMLLRRSFTDAEITLVCAPWNVALAQRLGVADIVIPLAYFSQASLADLDAAAVRQRHEEARRHLAGLGLPAYDLAIDLRRDEDTRALLTLVDARVRAGMGDQAVFGYLDIALPFSRHGVAAGCTKLRLGPADFDRDGVHRIEEDRLYLTGRVATFPVTLRTDAAWSPAEDGKDDHRVLAVALWSIFVRQQDDNGAGSGRQTQVTRDSLRFGPGWLAWEPWGRWSNEASSEFTVDVPLTGSAVELTLGVQGHTSPSHPRVTVTTRVGDQTIDQLFHAGDEPAVLTFCMTPQPNPSAVRTVPYLMRGGRYRGGLRLAVDQAAEWRPLTLTALTAVTRQVLATMVLPDVAPGTGELSFPFALEIVDSADPIEFVIQAPGEGADRVAILGLDLDWQQGGYPTMPTVHMEQQLLDLAAMAALRHAPHLVAGSAADVAERLTRRRRESSAQTILRLFADRRRRPLLKLPRRTRTAFIGIAIGANKETKRWPAPYFAALCRSLLRSPCVSIVLVGGPAEAAQAAELIAELDAGTRVIDAVSSCRIEDLGEVLAELDAFIGLDTGTTHFAGRVGLPTFAVFGASHDPVEWGPVGSRARWIAADVTCRGCSLSAASQCGAALACMTELTPDEVWPAVDGFLRRHVPAYLIADGGRV